MAITFFIRDSSLVKTPDGPNVVYAGKNLPAEAAPVKDPVVDPTVQYAGKNLPQQAAVPLLFPPDATNNPGLVIIGGVTLPPDCIVLLNGKKILEMSKILDGVSVVEHVGRDPYELDFDATFRISLDGGSTYVFPQDAIDNLWTNVWLPNSVQKIVNTYLNKLGIQEIIIEGIHPVTVRGSKNVPFKMKAIENVIGQSLIVTP